VKLRVYLTYFRACGRGLSIAVLALYVISAGASSKPHALATVWAHSVSVGSNFWLADWSNAGENPDAHVDNGVVVSILSLVV
jgi:hypothetical protein